MPRVNGNDIDLHYGDEVVTLEMRLERQDQQIAWLRRGMIALGSILVFHVLLPGQDVLTFILSLIGI